MKFEEKIIQEIDSFIRSQEAFRIEEKNVTLISISSIDINGDLDIERHSISFSATIKGKYDIGDDYMEKSFKLSGCLELETIIKCTNFEIY